MPLIDGIDGVGLLPDEPRPSSRGASEDWGCGDAVRLGLEVTRGAALDGVTGFAESAGVRAPVGVSGVGGVGVR